MMWIGSEWDTAPRVYKEGKTQKSAHSLVSEDWEAVRAHIVGLLEVREAIARQKAEHANDALKDVSAKLNTARSAARPE